MSHPYALDVCVSMRECDISYLVQFFDRWKNDNKIHFQLWYCPNCCKNVSNIRWSHIYFPVNGDTGSITLYHRRLIPLDLKGRPLYRSDGIFAEPVPWWLTMKHISTVRESSYLFRTTWTLFMFDIIQWSHFFDCVQIKSIRNIRSSFVVHTFQP